MPVQTGGCKAVIAGDTQGNVYSSYPLADDGNYKYWVRPPSSPRAPRQRSARAAPR